MASLMGKYQIRINTATLTDGDSIAAYITSAAGTLLTNTTNGAKQALDIYEASARAEDSAHTLGDLGDFMLAVRNDTESTIATADGRYAPLQVDNLGRLRVNADINVNNDFVFAEDSASTSGNLGASILSVRQDTLATDTSTDGDYSFIKANVRGEVYVFDTTTHTTLASLLSELQAVDYATNAAFTAGDLGILSQAVRHDANTTIATADGNYAPLQLDALGRLKVTATVTTATQYAEDSASASGDLGDFILTVRRDTTGTQTSTNGDYSELQTWSNGELKVVNITNSSILQQQVSVTNTATAFPTTPLPNRKSILIQNTGSAKVYIGSSTVTSTGATSGIELTVGDFIELEAGPAVPIYVVKTGATGSTLNLLESA